MVDLKELERRLDEALDKETPESLSDWLDKQNRNTIVEDLIRNALGDDKTLVIKEDDYD